MTIDGCTITDNTAGSRGGGIWNGGTLNMKGKVTVNGNTKDGGLVSNVFLKSGKVITVTGSLTGSSIGVEMESTSGTFTSGYNSNNSGVAPSTIFSADRCSIVDLGSSENGEACLTSKASGSVYFIERTWDETNKKVVNIEKTITGSIEVTNPPAEEPNQWFGMGGNSSGNDAEYYVVSGEVKRQTIVVQGSNVHLILCDNATLTLTGGLKLEGDNKLYIHSQSYGGAMGRLMVTNSYSDAAGIGSAQHKENDKVYNRVAGVLVIYGGPYRGHWRS